MRDPDIEKKIVIENGAQLVINTVRNPLSDT